MTNATQLGFDALNAALKAAGEETRLRVLALLAEAEAHRLRPHRHFAPVAAAHFAASQVVGEAGLIERFREGAWAFFRLRSAAAAPRWRARLLDHLNSGDTDGRA